jgi:hypothetical protein
MEEKILPKTFSKKTEFTTEISTVDAINRFKNKKDLRKLVQKMNLARRQFVAGPNKK